MSIKARPCEICKTLIEAERLENDAKTRLCIEHARLIAKFGGEFLMTSTHERLGKADSLKKHYGSVTPEWRRNQTAIEKLKREYEEGPRSEVKPPG